jgi:membrane protein
MFKAVFQWFKTIFINWNQHENSRAAAAIAFYTIFSLAPMLMVGVTLASWKFHAKETQEEIFKYVENTLGLESGQAVRTVAQRIGLDQIQFNQADIWASLLSLVILLIGASKMISELHSTLNIIFEVEKEKKGWWIWVRGKIVAVVVLILLGLLLVASLFLDTLLLSLGKMVETKLGFTMGFLVNVDRLIFFLMIPLLTAFYLKVLPAKSVPFKHLWFATLVSTVLFYVGKYLMSLYLSYSGVTSAYGAAGSLIVLLLWIYFSILVLLMGAEICHLSIESASRKKA